MTPLFSGTVTNGKLHLHKKGDFDNYLLSLEGKRIQLTVEKETNSRTNNEIDCGPQGARPGADS